MEENRKSKTFWKWSRDSRGEEAVGAASCESRAWGGGGGGKVGRWEGEQSQFESGPDTLGLYSAAAFFTCLLGNSGGCDSPSANESERRRVANGASEVSSYLLLQGRRPPCRCVSQQRVSICIGATLLMGKDGLERLPSPLPV